MKTTINQREQLAISIALHRAAAHRKSLAQAEQEIRETLEDDDANSHTLHAVWHGEPADGDEFLRRMGVTVQ